MNRRLGVSLLLIACVVFLIWVTTRSGEDTTHPTEDVEFALAGSPLEEAEIPLSSSFSLAAQGETATDEALSETSLSGQPTSEEATESPLTLRTTRVWGVVTGQEGAPIAEAVVTLIDSVHGFGAVLAATQTDFDGIYEIRDIHRLTSGFDRGIEVFVLADAPGHMTGLGSGGLYADGSEVRIDVQLPTATTGTDGNIRWEDGEAVAFAEIMALEDRTDSIARAESDAQGRFHLRGFASGDYLVFLIRPQGGMYRLVGDDINIQAPPIEIVLPRDVGVITGQVLGAVSRDPQPGFIVNLGNEISGLRALVQTTDAEGRFRFEGLPIGERMRFHLIPGEFLNSERSAHLTPDEPEDDVTLYLPEPFTVIGAAVDSDTGEPAPGLAITVRSGSLDEEALTRTDENGRFEATLSVTAADPGHARVTFGLPDPPWIFSSGVREKTEFIDLTSEEEEHVRLEVMRGFPLEVTALDPEGTPLEGVHLRFATVSAWTDRVTNTPLGETDAMGRLMVIRPEQMHECQIVGAHPDWPILMSPLVARRETSTVVQPPDMADLEVLVVDSEGAPVAGAEVAAEGSPGFAGINSPQYLRTSGGSRVSRQTDENGRVLFENRPRVFHSLRATLNDTSPPSLDESGRRRVRDTLIAEATDQIDLAHETADPVRVTMRLRTLSDVTVHGRVLDPRDNPIAGAEIRWIDPLTAMRMTVVNAPEGSEPPGAVTGADGQFTVTGTHAQSRHGLTVSCPGYLTENTHFISDDEMDIHLAPEITIRGRVTPIPEHSSFVLFQPAPLNRHREWSAVASRQPSPLDASGALSWTLPRLTLHRIDLSYPSPAWMLAIGREGGIATVDLDLGDEPSQVIDVGTLNLEPGHTLGGRVLSADREPVPEATVMWQARTAPPEGWESEFVWTAITDAEGRFTLRGLPRGLTHLDVRVNDNLRRVFEVEIPTSTSVDIVLDPFETTSLRIRLLEEPGSPIQSAETLVRNVERTLSGPVFTDGAGEAMHQDLPPGTASLTLSFTLPGCSMRLEPRIEITEDDQLEVVDLSTLPVLRGVVTRGGEPAPHAAMTLTMISEQGNTPTVALAADERGEFEVPLPEGEWQIWTDSTRPRAVVDVPSDERVEIDMLD